MAEGELCSVLKLIAEGFLRGLQVVGVVCGGEVMTHGEVTVVKHLHKKILTAY